MSANQNRILTKAAAAQDKVGLIAGWGDYPLVIARRLHEQGRQISCIAIRGHGDVDALKPYCTEIKLAGLAKMGGHARFFRRCGVSQATLAGKIFKTVIFKKFAFIRHLPDFAFTKHYYDQFITRTGDRNDDTLLLTAIRLFQTYGVEMVPATDFAPELLVKEGNLTRQAPSKVQLSDIEYGWHLAKQMGGLDVGQSVVVKGRAVLAVEAVEGTDECIRRAGSLCSGGGFTVVKVAKPKQDMRFDVPTIGVGTIKTISECGGSVLAIEAGKTIILDEESTVRFAEKCMVKIVALKAGEFGNLSSDTSEAA